MRLGVPPRHDRLTNLATGSRQAAACVAITSVKPEDEKDMDCPLRLHMMG